MLSGFFAKTVDFVFRAYYSQRLGGEGLGILSLCFAVHGIMLNISSGGIGAAISKLVSEQLLKKEYGRAKTTISVALWHTAVISIAVAVAVMLSAEYIAEVFLKEPRGARCIVYISPSIVFMGISYCIKGYFYASRRVFSPASSEFLEQLVKISVITLLLSMWLPLGVEKGCEAVCLGLSIGEFCSCMYLLMFYVAEQRKNRSTGYSGLKIYTDIIKISLPVAISALAMSFLRLREDVLVISALKKSGMEHKNALRIYGNIKGMIMPLIIFPLTLLSSFFTMLVPEISRACSMESKVRLKTLVSKIYRFCTTLGFAVMCVFMIFSESLAEMIYSAPEISDWLKAISLFVPFMFMDSVSAGILNGMGRQTSLLIHGLSDSVIRIILVWALVPRFGINAFLLVIAVSNIFTCTLTVSGVLKSADMSFRVFGWCLKHLICSGATIYTVQNMFSGFAYGSSEKTIFGICLTAVLYIFWAGALEGNTRSDFRWLMNRAFLS